MGHCFSCLRAPTDNSLQMQLPAADKDEMREQCAGVGLQAEPLLQEASKCGSLAPRTHLMSPPLNHNTLVLAAPTAPVAASLASSAPEPHKLTDRTPRSFYHKLGGNETKVSDNKINQLFDQYKEVSEDAILAEGIENLCNDLQLDPDEFKVLVLAWKLNASQMCRFTRSEFLQGLKSMRTDSIKGIQTRLTELTEELQCNPELFKDLYRFTFKFGLDVSTGQRILPADVAVVLWRLVFTYTTPPILPRWLHYLESNPHIRGIPKDTWYMFLNFCEYVREDLSTYDDTEAWPSLFDDFVEYENDQVNQNISKIDIKMLN